MMKRKRNNSVTIGILLCLGVSSFVIYMLFTEARQTAQEEKGQLNQVVSSNGVY